MARLWNSLISRLEVWRFRVRVLLFQADQLWVSVWESVSGWSAHHLGVARNNANAGVGWIANYFAARTGVARGHIQTDLRKGDQSYVRRITMFCVRVSVVLLWYLFLGNFLSAFFTYSGQHLMALLLVIAGIVVMIGAIIPSIKTDAKNLGVGILTFLYTWAIARPAYWGLGLRWGEKGKKKKKKKGP